MARSIEPDGDGEADGAADGEELADGVAVADDAVVEVLGVVAADPDGLPHAATNRTATNADCRSALGPGVIAGAMFPCWGVGIER